MKMCELLDSVQNIYDNVGVARTRVRRVFSHHFRKMVIRFRSMIGRLLLLLLVCPPQHTRTITVVSLNSLLLPLILLFPVSFLWVSVPPSSFLLLPTAVLLVFHQRRQQHTQTILKEAQNDHRKGTVEIKKRSKQKNKTMH